MIKILITGGSGFIGTNLIENLKLAGNYNICNIDIANPNIKDHEIYWKKIDIRNKIDLNESITAFNPEVVIHLAARTDLNGKNLKEYDSNTVGLSNLIEVLNNQEKLSLAIFASSMYVCRPGYVPIDFEDYEPHTIYGESKVITEKQIKSAKLNFTWAILRPTSIWGPWFGEPYANFFNIILHKKYFHLGSKACTKTYGYIDNTVFQILSLINASPEMIHKKVFYIGDWPAYNISEWADEIAECFGIKIRIIPFVLFRLAALMGDLLKIIGIKFPMTSFRLKNMTTDNVQDLTPIGQIVPTLPFSRKEGVKKTVEWIQRNKG